MNAKQYADVVKAVVDTAREDGYQLWWDFDTNSLSFNKVEGEWPNFTYPDSADIDLGEL